MMGINSPWYFTSKYGNKYFIINLYSITSREVDQLTGNLPELARYQPSILKELEDCSR